MKTKKQIKKTDGYPAAAKVAYPYIIGEKYFIRGVTMYYTGRLVDATATELVIEDAAWIANTKRWADTLRTHDLDEVEPYPDGRVIIGRGSVVDAAVWSGTLPRGQK